MRPNDRSTFRDRTPILKAWTAPSLDRFQLTEEQIAAVRSATDQPTELAKIYAERKALRKR